MINDWLESKEETEAVKVDQARRIVGFRPDQSLKKAAVFILSLSILFGILKIVNIYVGA